MEGLKAGGSRAETVLDLFETVLEGIKLGFNRVGFKGVFVVDVGFCLENGETYGVLEVFVKEVVVPEFRIDGIVPENVKGLVGTEVDVNGFAG